MAKVTGKEVLRVAEQIARSYQVFPLVLAKKKGFVVLDGMVVRSLAASLISQAKGKGTVLPTKPTTLPSARKK